MVVWFVVVWRVVSGGLVCVCVCVQATGWRVESVEDTHLEHHPSINYTGEICEPTVRLSTCTHHAVFIIVHQTCQSQDAPVIRV